MKNKWYDYIEPSDRDYIKYKLDGYTLIAIINQCYTLYQNIEDNKFYIAYRWHNDNSTPNVIYYANDTLDQFKEMLSVFSTYEDSNRKLANHIYHDNWNESKKEYIINYSDEYRLNKSLSMFKHFINQVYRIDKSLFEINKMIGFNDCWNNNKLMFWLYAINESVIDLHEWNYNVPVISLMIDESSNVVEYDENKYKWLNYNDSPNDDSKLPF